MFAVTRVFGGIVEQIGQHPVQPLGIQLQHRRQRTDDLEDKAILLPARQFLALLRHRVDQRVHIHRSDLQGISVITARIINQIIDHGQHVLGTAADDAATSGILAAAGLHHIGKSQNRGQRRAQIVTDARQKIGLGMIGLIGRNQGLAQLLRAFGNRLLQPYLFQRLRLQQGLLHLAVLAIHFQRAADDDQAHHRPYAQLEQPRQLPIGQPALLQYAVDFQQLAQHHQPDDHK